MHCLTEEPLSWGLLQAGRLLPPIVVELQAWVERDRKTGAMPQQVMELLSAYAAPSLVTVSSPVKRCVSPGPRLSVK